MKFTKKNTPAWLLKARQNRKGTDVEVTLQAFSDWSDDKIAKALRVDVAEVQEARNPTKK